MCARDEKLCLREKVAFFFANIGNIPVTTLIGGYLLIFYTDVVGMDAAAVGTLFLITKIFDALNDPLIGYLIDQRPRTKFGKFRKVLLAGSVICALNYMLIWYGPALVPTSLKLFVAYISYFLLGITFSVMDISLNSMIPVMTDDAKERSALSSIKGVGYMAGSMIISIGVPLVINAYADKRTAYFILVGIASAAIAVFSVGGALGVNERVGASENQKYSVKQMFGFLTLEPVLITFLSQLLFSIGGAIGGTTEIYYMIYVMEDVTLLTKASLFKLIGMTGAVLLNTYLVRIVGKRIVYSSGILLISAALFLRLLDVHSVPLIYVSFILSGLGSSLVMVLMYGIQADNIDYVEYRGGMRAEGAISSLQSLVAKLGHALGGTIPAYILASTGYVANAEQTQSTIHGIIFSVTIVPAVIQIVSALLFLLRYRLDSKELEKAQHSLRRRRAMEK